MPEGPEIWRAAAELADVLEGQRVVHAEFTQPHLRRYGKALTGQLITRVDASGKAIVSHFDSHTFLYSHNQLYGLWYIRPAGVFPDTQRTLRVVLQTAEHNVLLYSASDIEILDDAELALHPYLSKLGPEALDPEVTWQDIVARLLDPGFTRRKLAALYLDQHFVAGIGNYLRSEILFTAGLHPALRPTDLTRGKLDHLARATLAITRRSLKTKGVTNAPARVRKLKNQGASYEGYRFAVFARAGKPCYQCRAPIRRVTMSSRRLYFCPQCQPESGA